MKFNLATMYRFRMERLSQESSQRKRKLKLRLQPLLREEVSAIGLIPPLAKKPAGKDAPKEPTPEELEALEKEKAAKEEADRLK